MLVIKRIKIPLTVKYFVLNWEKRWNWFDFPWWVWMSSLIMLVWLLGLLGLVKTGVPVLVFRFWETVFSLKNFDLFKSKAGLDQPYFLLSISLLLISVIIDFLVPSDVLTAEEQRDILLMIARRSPLGTPISINILPRRSVFTIIAFIFYHKITNHSAIAGWFRLVFRRLKFSLFFSVYVSICNWNFLILPTFEFSIFFQSSSNVTRATKLLHFLRQTSASPIVFNNRPVHICL